MASLHLQQKTPPGARAKMPQAHAHACCNLHPAKPLPASSHRHFLRSAKDNASEKDTSQTRCQIHDAKELSRVFEFDRKDCQSREQPAVDENSEKNTSPNAGIPLFHVASGISLRQREAFVVCRATTTISQHQHGNRCRFQMVATFLIEPTRARCATNNETAGSKGQERGGVQRQQIESRLEEGVQGARAV